MLAITSCKKEEEPSINTNQTVISSSELSPYIQTFIAEGRKRGHSIPDDLDGITYEIKALEENGIAGVCYWSSNQPNHIVINSAYWNQFNSDQKEAVLFHELGHCYLNREHNDAALPSGNCTSLMHSGTVQNCIHAYSGTNKTYYLDELFDSSVLN